MSRSDILLRASVSKTRTLFFVPTSITLPVVVVLERVHIDGPKRAAVTPQIPLSVSAEVEAAQHVARPAS